MKMLLGLFLSIPAWAQAAAPSQPSMLEQFFPFILIFVVFFLFIIRPAQKRQKAQSTFLTGLKRGDSVLTSGGILGTIEGLTELYATLEIAPGVKIRVLRSSIASAYNEEKAKS